MENIVGVVWAEVRCGFFLQAEQIGCLVVWLFVGSHVLEDAATDPLTRLDGCTHGYGTP
jgi:hypothetical protein